MKHPLKQYTPVRVVGTDRCGVVVQPRYSVASKIDRYDVYFRDTEETITFNRGELEECE
jgi:hypothetical protein